MCMWVHILLLSIAMYRAQTHLSSAIRSISSLNLVRPLICLFVIYRSVPLLYGNVFSLVSDFAAHAIVSSPYAVTGSMYASYTFCSLLNAAEFWVIRLITSSSCGLIFFSLSEVYVNT